MVISSLNCKLNSIEANLLGNIDQLITLKEGELEQLRDQEQQLEMLIQRHRETDLIIKAINASGQINEKVHSAISREEIARNTRKHNEAIRDIKILDAEIAGLRSDRISIQAERFTNLDKPNEIIQLNETNELIATLHVKIQENEHTRQQLFTQHQAESARIEALRQATLTAPISGSLWQLKTAADAYVRPGDELIALADESSIVVESYLHQRHRNNLNIGDYAFIQLPDTNNKIMGVVQYIHEPDDTLSDPNDAYQLVPPKAEQFKVIIEIPDRRKSADLIGQRVRVLLTDQQPSFVKRSILAIFTTFSL